MHPQANPSQAEILKKQFKSKAEDLKAKRKRPSLKSTAAKSIWMVLTDWRLLPAKTTSWQQQPRLRTERKATLRCQHYTEEIQSRWSFTQGRRHNEAVALKSKYEEDVFINGHTTVWGSYFHKGAFRWGYADDHSLMKKSYCTGENGRKANDEANEMRYGTGVAGSAALAQAREMLKSIPTEERKGGVAPPRNVQAIRRGRPACGV